MMLGDMRVERVRTERLAAAEQVEPIRGYDQMQIADFGADGAIAIGDFELRGRPYLEADAAAVTTACMRNHDLNR